MSEMPMPVLPKYGLRTPIIVKVSVSGGQARLTIPKELAVYMGLLTETGEQGQFTHAIVKRDIKNSIYVSFSKIAEETT